jgi:type VI secretion system secreted protein VgrG
MPTYTQAGRLMAVTTPLGADVLLLETLVGTEGLSDPFQFELGLLAADSSQVKFESVLGQSVTVAIQLPDGSSRYWNGIVSRFSQGAQVRGVGGDVTFTRYRAEVVPQLWLLGLVYRTRIFQQKSVPDILKEVLTGLTVGYELQGTYNPRDYCTQYRETDLAFASRLMEEEGIYFYFKHADGSHTMVVADTPQSHADVPGPTTLIYDTVAGGNRAEDRITGWEKTQEVRSGKVTLWDHCFELPGQNLEATKTILGTVAAGTVTHKLNLEVSTAAERYEYPGRYAQRFDGVTPDGGDRASDVQNIFQDNARTAGIRMQQEATPAVRIVGEGGARHLSAGHKFTLDRHPDANGDYVLTRVRHEATLEGQYTGAQNAGIGYANRFECIPVALPYRPELRIPRPVAHGTQSAVVVGPSGEEIFTDKYGRIKVQFAWHREGTNDANSSCWVRIATSWAGKQWGAIRIPRIGQEVVVAYEEGDPDRPIAVGSVYNADQMPPYTLPDNRTQSGVKSRSSLSGTAENYNELRFEDKKDSEEVYFHAEKDFNRVVENNDTLKVGFEKKDKGDRTVEVFNNHTVTIGAGKTEADDGSETVTVFNNRTTTVGDAQASGASETLTVYKDRTTTVKTGNESLTVEQGNRTVTVNTGNDTHTVKTGNRSVEVDTGNDTHTIKTGNRAVEIDMGNDTLTIKMGNQTTKLNLGASSTEAMQSIELKVGGNSIKIDQTGVTISGIMVKVQGQAQAQVQAPMTQVSGDGMLTLKGGVMMVG